MSYHEMNRTKFMSSNIFKYLVFIRQQKSLYIKKYNCYYLKNCKNLYKIASN